MIKNATFLLLFISVLACNEKQINIPFNSEMSTYSNYDSVFTKHLEWEANVDFENQNIKGVATWTFVNKLGAKSLRMDAYDLTISKVLVNGRSTQFILGEFNPEYGNGLSIPILPDDTIVSIEYKTGPQAKALQWLKPSQTAGKKYPYLFTQCESIQARSLLPCQDIPALRITYNAEVKVPSGMMALMSAKNPIQKNAAGLYNFEMELPIPSYLIALAVGDIEYKAIDSRCGVYTEPVLMAKAFDELQDVPAMMRAAESICGPYRWGKYDVLIAPPSFPIGGMENPRLTFSTPTIIAGDKSLVSLIAHEMAHSWSGNLVTNATWDDIWLNEGFTTYFERRIMESLAGKSYTDMLWEQGYQDMENDFKELGLNSPDTRLRIELNGRNSENAFTNIPYEKGALLRTLEEQVGRSNFDSFLNAYLDTFAFKPITTAICTSFMEEKLIHNSDSLKQLLQLNEWIFKPGLPSTAKRIMPERFILVDKQRQAFELGAGVNSLSASNWSTHEWLQFLRALPRPQLVKTMEELDQKFKLSKSGNSEIAAEWFKLSLASNYEPAYPEIENFLNVVGRKKFLEPIYAQMMKTDKGKKMAWRIFEESKKNYHPLTALKIQKVLSK